MAGSCPPVFDRAIGPAASASRSNCAVLRGETTFPQVARLERVTGIEPALSAWESDRSGPLTAPELGSRCTASDHDGPCDTGANGPPMARRLIVQELAQNLSRCRLRVSPPWAITVTAVAAQQRVQCLDRRRSAEYRRQRDPHAPTASDQRGTVPPRPSTHAGPAPSAALPAD